MTIIFRGFMGTVTSAAAGAVLLMLAVPPALGDGGAGPAGQAIRSVPELLASPAAFEGQVVAAQGYLRPHVLYLFSSRELAEEQDWSAGLIVGDEPSGSIRDSACPGQVVEMTGTFRRLDPGIYGLTDIRVIRQADGEVCWQAD